MDIYCRFPGLFAEGEAVEQGMGGREVEAGAGVDYDWDLSVESRKIGRN